ncbi:membrane fusion protein, multidrug efflux system [Cyclobacterium lianum]|uniref:Membrane fusion protein, multidrug efflux system n=1 Tax=Cyclobacterium lianum TaxID=388280 RepID=A0A1M7LZT6_9BACT|nr:efflux RND transporter periplasmic adaptor subunit [Cyclobacterium lianum]SHM83765.1 membrane fusion protein, multidrug efflux system [Cyclobacterium lianum]
MKNPMIVYLFAVLVLYQSCSEGKSENSGKTPLPSFPVFEVPVKSVTGYESYPVSIEGMVSSAVRAKVSGYITEVLVDEGQAVKKGQPLFKLETQSLDEDADAAKANVQAAKVEVEKLKPLVEKGIIGGVQLETARARLAQAEAAYKSIAASINYATIKSPVEGYVGGVPFRQGALVSPSDPQPLTTVSQVENMFAFFSMNEKDYLNMLQRTQGQSLDEKLNHMPQVELELVNGQIYAHKGEIKTVTGQVNPSTGTVNFRATFPNPDRLLAHGNSGMIRIPKVYEGYPLITEISATEQQGKAYVYRVGADSLVSRVPVKVQARVDQLVVVEEGVREGDQIVYEGAGKLRDQSKIRPQMVDFDSIAQKLKIAFK